MKAIKIILVVVVVAIIGYFVWQGMYRSGNGGGGNGIVGKPTCPPINQFIQRVEQEIDSLGKMPDNRFCKDFYNDIAYHIEDFCKNGKFGNSQSDNNQMKENLSRILYAAYTQKFIDQAFYVFNGSEWNVNDLRFIRNEYQTLRIDSLLEKSSIVNQKFTEIHNIFSKYDEIENFIYHCQHFSYPKYNLSNHFPVSDVKNKISTAHSYLNIAKPIRNCTRLRDRLQEVPQTLFSAHVRYLENKINRQSGKYRNFKSQKNYANSLFRPLRKEIDQLDNHIYNVSASTFRNNYNHLVNLWDSDSSRAYRFFNTANRFFNTAN